MNKQQLLDEIRHLTLWGSYPSSIRPGSQEDLLWRITEIRRIVEKEGAKLS